MPSKTPLPRVILHNAVSLDCKIDGFTPDIGLFYELASTWKEDATLAGADTLLAAILESDNADDLEPSKPPVIRRGDKRPLLVVPDSREESDAGRIFVRPAIGAAWRRSARNRRPRYI